MERSRTETLVFPCPTPKIIFERVTLPGLCHRGNARWRRTIGGTWNQPDVLCCWAGQCDPLGKNRKMTLSDSSMTKHSFISAGPQVVFPSQALGNIWTTGRQQALRLQLHYFSCKDDQGENLKRMLCATRPLFRGSGDSSSLSLAGYGLAWPSLTSLTLRSVWPPGH